MAVQIEINDAHVDALIDFYIQRLRILRDEIAEREREAKDINAQIIKLKRGRDTPSSITTSVSNHSPLVAYSDKWPWVKKIRFAIELSGRPLTTKEIVETLIEFEIGLMLDRKKAVASISSILSTKSGDGKDFIRLEGESGDFAYDLNTEGSENVDEGTNPFE